MAESPRRRIGLISDTHGLLRPQALDALQGSDHIIHAGDIVEPAILDELSAIATLTCVRGNNDRGAWAAALPETAIVEEACVRILVIHDLKQLHLNARAAGLAAVVSGHSHRPRVDRRDGVLRVPTSVIDDEGHVYVFDPATSRVAARPITRGISNWEFTEVTDGLREGERVVSSIDRDGVVDGAVVTPE